MNIVSSLRMLHHPNVSILELYPFLSQKPKFKPDFEILKDKIREEIVKKVATLGKVPPSQGRKRALRICHFDYTELTLQEGICTR